MRNSNLPQGFSPLAFGTIGFTAFIEQSAPQRHSSPRYVHFSLVLSIGISHPSADFLPTTST